MDLDELGQSDGDSSSVTFDVEGLDLGQDRKISCDGRDDVGEASSHLLGSLKAGSITTQGICGILKSLGQVGDLVDGIDHRLGRRSEFSSGASGSRASCPGLSRDNRCWRSTILGGCRRGRVAERL